MTQLFYNLQFKEWLWKEFDCYIDAAYDNLKKDLMKRDDEEAEQVLIWAAKTKMTSQAYIELAHHKQKLKKCCGFGDCKYMPGCLRGME